MGNVVHSALHRGQSRQSSRAIPVDKWVVLQMRVLFLGGGPFYEGPYCIGDLKVDSNTDNYPSALEQDIAGGNSRLVSDCAGFTKHLYP